MKHDRLPSRSSRSLSNWEIRCPLGRSLRIPTALVLQRSVAGAFLSSHGRHSLSKVSFSPSKPGQLIIASSSSPSSSSSQTFASVTGVIYEPATKEGNASDSAPPPQVTLFTKEGCTLCDKVKDILYELKNEIPHSLNQIDITDEEHHSYFAKYKCDIPVLHVNGQCWIKHRVTLEEAREGLMQATREGNAFEARPGEPNAEAMEH